MAPLNLLEYLEEFSKTSGYTSPEYISPELQWVRSECPLANKTRPDGTPYHFDLSAPADHSFFAETTAGDANCFRCTFGNSYPSGAYVPHCDEVLAQDNMDFQMGSLVPDQDIPLPEGADFHHPDPHTEEAFVSSREEIEIPRILWDEWLSKGNFTPHYYRKSVRDENGTRWEIYGCVARDVQNSNTTHYFHREGDSWYLGRWYSNISDEFYHAELLKPPAPNEPPMAVWIVGNESEADCLQSWFQVQTDAENDLNVVAICFDGSDYGLPGTAIHPLRVLAKKSHPIVLWTGKSIPQRERESAFRDTFTTPTSAPRTYWVEPESINQYLTPSECIEQELDPVDYAIQNLRAAQHITLLA